MEVMTRAFTLVTVVPQKKMKTIVSSRYWKRRRRKRTANSLNTFMGNRYYYKVLLDSDLGSSLPLSQADLACGLTIKVDIISAALLKWAYLSSDSGFRRYFQSNHA